MHCISCSTFYRCSHRLFFRSMRKFPPTDVRFTQNRVFHLDRNLFLLSGGRPLETLGLCGKRLECAGKGATQVCCFFHCPCWSGCLCWLGYFLCWLLCNHYMICCLQYLLFKAWFWERHIRGLWSHWKKWTFPTLPKQHRGSNWHHIHQDIRKIIHGLLCHLI